MEIRTPLLPRPSCNDLPGVEAKSQCKLPVAHLAERKAAETGEMGHELAKVVADDVNTHKLTHDLPGVLKAVGLGRLGHALHVSSPAVAAFNGTKGLAEMSKLTSEHAALRASAVGREQHDLAMAFVAEQAKPGVFPEGYVSARRDAVISPNAKLGDTRHTPHVVNRVIAQMDQAVEAGNAGAKDYVAYWAHNAQAGVREAQAGGVRDEASLQAACKTPSFRAAYDKDPAFREGVRAAMWQATNHPAAFDAAHSAIVKLRDQAAQAQLGRPS